MLATFKERVDLISDSAYLIRPPFSWFQSKKQDETSYIMRIVDISQSQNEEDNIKTISAEISELKESQQKILE